MIVHNEKLTQDLIDECSDIILTNYKETGQLSGDLDIDWDMYMSIKDNFITFILRDDELNVKGILFFIIGNYPHNKNLKMAQQVTFYVLHEFRQHSLEIMKYSEKYFLEEGFDIILQSARYGSNFCKTLEKRGYMKEDITFIKRLN